MNIWPKDVSMGHFDQPVTLGNASQHVVHAGDSFSLRILQLASNPVAKGRKLPRPHRQLMLSIACISAADFPHVLDRPKDSTVASAPAPVQFLNSPHKPARYDRFNFT
jgi:hypothetical protein